MQLQKKEIHDAMNNQERLIMKWSKHIWQEELLIILLGLQSLQFYGESFLALVSGRVQSVAFKVNM